MKEFLSIEPNNARDIRNSIAQQVSGSYARPQSIGGYSFGDRCSRRLWPAIFGTDAELAKPRWTPFTASPFLRAAGPSDLASLDSSCRRRVEPAPGPRPVGPRRFGVSAPASAR